MKRNRNSFFTETNTQSGFMAPNMNNMMPTQNANSSFYQGPTNPYNYNTQPNELESRLAKIERQINRIDYRLSKLENQANIISTDDYDINDNNMYMV